MSDSMRESVGDKAKSNLKPDSQKSTLEKGQEQVQGAADSVGKTLQPEGEKSATQKATDTVSGGSSDAQKQGQSVLGQAQEGLSNAANSASEALGLNSAEVKASVNIPNA